MSCNVLSVMLINDYHSIPSHLDEIRARRMFPAGQVRAGHLSAISEPEAERSSAIVPPHWGSGRKEAGGPADAHPPSYGFYSLFWRARAASSSCRHATFAAPRLHWQSFP